MPLQPEPLYSAETIAHRIQEIAHQLDTDFSEKSPVCLITLKGAVHFGSDLMRAMTLPMEVDFIRARSYVNASSSGNVELLYTPTTPLHGREIVLVEDILDTGRTALALRMWLNEHDIAACSMVSLLDKPSRREVDIQADYVGFSIENHFVVGYGMDYNEQYRELPDIRIWEP